jgi:patatin-related protein
MAVISGSIQKEIRFSVVMYGGISLAIYINGVSQELFHMVRATARKSYPTSGKPHSSEYLVEEDCLSGTEKVYRKIGEVLRASFVVDILSGSSAGGINAVFLAKAFANQQDFTISKDLWLLEGDINKLINDGKSFIDTNLLTKKMKSNSLLNSHRMYYKLLESLDKMEGEDRDSKFESAYVGELDLFITATDLRGLPLPLPISSLDVLENQYRASFRFHYSTEDAGGENSNHFLKKENPFLAFVARCTSSFPVAFEPMCLEDTKQVIECDQFKDSYQYAPENWSKFFGGYDLKVFVSQPFVDGGSLDNKPFSYAVDTLSKRGADLPVDRKMIYIEPAPEHVQMIDVEQPINKPDTFDNVFMSGVALPRQETIREDLKVIAERNQKISQINRILQKLTRVTKQVLRESKTYWQKGGSKWYDEYLEYSIESFGVSYAVYHQLRVANILKELTEALRRNLGLEENSREYKRLVDLIENEWHPEYYTSIRDGRRASENKLLFRLDISYRIRRLQFLQLTINRLQEYACAVLENSPLPDTVSDYFSMATTTPDFTDPQQEQAFREELQAIKGGLNDAFITLRSAGRTLRKRNLSAEDEAILELPAGYTQKLEQIREKLKTENRNGLEAGALIEEITQLMNSDNPTKRGYLRGKLSEANSLCESVLPDLQQSHGVVSFSLQSEQSEQDQARLSAREIITYLYRHYEYYDMLTYPLLNSTPLGEAGKVDVSRISPQDATSIIDERVGKVRKLVGTQFYNFGAFFDLKWRENDLLWGRLDGAECLIKAVMPDDSPERARLILEAHDAILAEDLLPALEKTLGSAEVPEPGIVDGESSLVQAFRAREISRNLSRKRVLSLALRSSPIVIQLLDEMKNRPQLRNPLTVLVALFATAFLAWHGFRSLVKKGQNLLSGLFRFSVKEARGPKKPTYSR